MSGEERIQLVIKDAMVDCRRDQLWQKLLLDRGPSCPSLSHLEFLELISLVHHQTLDKVFWFNVHTKEKKFILTLD